MNKRWIKEQKKEPYYRLAKKENYYSRASYKLLQLNKKFNIIKRGSKVVDLGAAPGGWSQVALKKTGEEGLVVGVDLQRIKPILNENFIKIQGDFTTEETLQRIEQVLRGKADVILSDASPKLSGIKDVDQIRSMELAENALKTAQKLLRDDGTLVMKVFQGRKFDELLKKIKKRFKIVKTTKPTSSRKRSVEMYVVAKKIYRT